MSKKQIGGAAVVILLCASLINASPAMASPTLIQLGDVQSFAVFAGTTVTAAGTSTITGNLGVSPGTAVTGFPPSHATGTIHTNDLLAQQARSSVEIAYNDAVSRTSTQMVGVADLSTVGTAGVLTPGVYSSLSSLSLTGAVTLDGLDDSSSVFIFQAGSTLITATASEIVLINGAQAGNIFWQVGSSATLGTDSVFAGTILAHTAITTNAGVEAVGRFLSLGAAMTLGAGANVTLPTFAATPDPVVPDPLVVPEQPADRIVRTVLYSDIECFDGWVEDVVQVETFSTRYDSASNSWVEFLVGVTEVRENNRLPTVEQCDLEIILPVEPPEYASEPVVQLTPVTNLPVAIAPTILAVTGFTNIFPAMLLALLLMLAGLAATMFTKRKGGTP